MKILKAYSVICMLALVNFINIALCSPTNNITSENKFEPKIFEYFTLAKNKDEVRKTLHDYGFIAIRGVPHYIEKKNRYFELAQEFIALDDDRKNQSTPKDAFARGWSYGIEVFNGKKDAYKGSYYIVISGSEEEINRNIWPSKDWELAADFKEAYTDLANIIFQTGKEILPIIGLDFQYLSATGRMLYYGAIPEIMEEDNSYWCGIHRDHGLFTGLIPAMYKKDGIIVAKPEGAGLYIRNQEIIVPDDVVLFQVGETADLITDQSIKATDHHVKKAYGGYERYSFALFFGIDGETKINASKIDPEYQSRYKYGMTFKDWCNASLDRYK